MNFRHRQQLDGVWQFQLDRENRISPGELPAQADWRTAVAPMPWQAQFDDLRHTSGTAWYRRTFTITDRHTESAILHFGAVDYYATVWINGEQAGSHEGGYLPFEVDVTHLLRIGENELVVRVADPTDDAALWPDYPFSEIPHGKQSWYGPISGIWQSVWLEWRPAVHFLALRLTPNAKTAQLEVDAQLSFTLTNHLQVEARLFSPAGHELLHTELDAQRHGVFQLDPAQLALWSPDSPACYRLEATLISAGEALDEISATCGFRTVAARNGRIYLNDEPIYLRGALDQAYYPQTIYTPPSIAFLEDQIRKAKALGLNCLRCHIKIEDPRYYEVADRLGMLIWTEIPNWSLLSEEASHRVKTTFQRMVERDWNHPSIFAWTLVNENWGTALTCNPEHRRWLADFAAEARLIDPHRLIVDNSACVPNFHVAGDIEDYHMYYAIPDHADEWDNWVADFARRPAWVWAADHQANRRADLPLIVSEFGNWGLPDPAQIQENGREPWWFETGLEWGEGIVSPHGFTERYHYWGMNEVFGDFDHFIGAAQVHMAKSLAYEIATMRLQPTIAGYVITEFTDVHWECNGLLDMQRHVKQGLETILAPLNQARVLVLRPEQWSGRPGETLAVKMVACDVSGEATNGAIRWQAAGAQGKLAAPGGVAQIELTEPGLLTIRAEWIDDGGEIIAHNFVEVAVIAPATPALRVHVVENEPLAQSLRQLGYAVTTNQHEQLERGVVQIVSQYDHAVENVLQKGARVLLLAAELTADAELALPVATLRPRANTAWQGDWATSISWLKKTGPFAQLPGAPLLEMEYAPMMPDVVISGIPAWRFPDRSWAGLAVGWLHKPVSLLARLPYGRGALTITTFKLSPSLLEKNAVAQALMAGLTTLAA